MTDRSSSSQHGFHPASTPDYVPLPRLRALQSVRLETVVRRTYDHVPLFRQRLEDRGLRPEDIRGLDHLRLLPFTTKGDLRDSYPFGLFASPMQEVVRLHASSGTTGKPIVAAYTSEDVGVWTDAMMRCLAACGLSHGDIVQNAYGYGLFTGGLGAHYGAEALGATVIPISGGNTDRQILIMKDFGVTAICCTPSYFIHLLERAAELGVDLKELPLRVGVFGAEPWTDSMRRHIETRSGIRAYDMIIIRGVNVYPSQVEAALLAVEGTLPHYQIVLTRQKGLDEMEVLVEVTPEVFSDKIGALEKFNRKLVRSLERTLGIRVAARLVEPHTIQRSEGKAKRVLDRRNPDP